MMPGTRHISATSRIAARFYYANPTKCHQPLRVCKSSSSRSLNGTPINNSRRYRFLRYRLFSRAHTRASSFIGSQSPGFRHANTSAFAAPEVAGPPETLSFCKMKTPAARPRTWVHSLEPRRGTAERPPKDRTLQGIYSRCGLAIRFEKFDGYELKFTLESTCWSTRRQRRSTQGRPGRISRTPQ